MPFIFCPLWRSDPSRAFARDSWKATCCCLSRDFPGKRAVFVGKKIESLSSGQSVSADKTWQTAVSELAECSVYERWERLRQVAKKGSALFRRYGGSVGVLVRSVGPRYFAPHVSTTRAQSHFGDSKVFPKIQQLPQVLSPGALVEVKAGGCLEAEVANGNHPSINPKAEKIVDNIVSDVAMGRALVFDTAFIREVIGLRVSRLGVVEEKFKIIHDLNFAAATDRRVRSSVNHDTDMECALECLLYNGAWAKAHSLTGSVFATKPWPGIGNSHLPG